MITKENKEVRSVAVCLIVILLLNLGSILLEFDTVNFIYFIFVVYVYQKYKYINKIE
jgi:hypothetical protein